MPYHVTPASNLRSILSKGILPQVGRRSKICRENAARSYFFPDLADLEDALLNWFGEVFEETEEGLAILEVELDGL